jgi:hypothetical protein
MESFDKWVSSLTLKGVDITIGNDVSLDRLIKVLEILAIYKIRPHVMFGEVIEGDHIFLREAFLAPVPKNERVNERVN